MAVRLRDSTRQAIILLAMINYETRLLKLTPHSLRMNYDALNFLL